MTSLAGQACLLVVFSAALAAVVSGYRDEEPHAILRGTLRRTLHFGAAVMLIGAAAQLVDFLLLRPS